MLNNERSSQEANDIEARTERALTECMTVLDTDGCPVSNPDIDVCSVISGSGETYTVDVDSRTCTCPDHQHNHRQCKHIRRARFALGCDVIDAALLRELDIHTDFAHHTPGPVVAASDGGILGAQEEAEDQEAEHEEEEVTGLDQPKRSESADFGLGESTGLQEL
jgi:hypothetical protein